MSGEGENSDITATGDAITPGPAVEATAAANAPSNGQDTNPEIGSISNLEDAASLQEALARAKAREARLAALQYMIPSATAEYHQKNVFIEFLLEERDLVGVPSRTVRNPGKPYPDKFYKGEDLIAAAKKKFGGLEEFVTELKSYARSFVADPLNTPSIRYLMLCPMEDQLRAMRQNNGMMLISKPTDQAKLVSMFQESEMVVLIISPVHNRGLRTWATMETMPDITGYFRLDINDDTHVAFRDVPSLYEDQIDCFKMDMKELPTNLGHQAVVSLASALFDQELSTKRRLQRSRKRSRSRDRDRDRERDRERENRRKKTPEAALHPTSLNLLSAPANLSFEEAQKLEARRVIEKRKRQGFYL